MVSYPWSQQRYHWRPAVRWGRRMWNRKDRRAAQHTYLCSRRNRITLTLVGNTVVAGDPGACWRGRRQPIKPMHATTSKTLDIAIVILYYGGVKSASVTNIKMTTSLSGGTLCWSVERQFKRRLDLAYALCTRKIWEADRVLCFSDLLFAGLSNLWELAISGQLLL